MRECPLGDCRRPSSKSRVELNVHVPHESYGNLGILAFESRTAHRVCKAAPSAARPIDGDVR